jgi:hypothetical protein
MSSGPRCANPSGGCGMWTMRNTTPLPEAWAVQSPWRHRTRRRWVTWLPRWQWVQRGLTHLPRPWRSSTCETEAPATRCTCSMYSIRWGMWPAAQQEDYDDA